MGKNWRGLLLLCWMFLSQMGNAQFVKELDYKVETGVSFSGGAHTPLWLSANRQGLGSIQKNSGYVLAGVSQAGEFGKGFSYAWGLELAGAYRSVSPFFVRQAYADFRWRFLGLSIGSKCRDAVLKNQELSSGGLTFSGNSLPIPQVRLGIPDYLAVPGTGGWFSFKGYIAYGMFTDGRWQEDFASAHLNKYVTKTLFHDKAIFFKIGNGKFPLTVEGGLDMPARFSGDFHQYNAKKGAWEVTAIPHRVKDFWRVLVPSRGDAENLPMDQANIVGDMLGSWNFSVEYRVKDWKLRAYFEHQFNDHSQLFGEYGWKDGLLGLELSLPRNPYVSCMVYEHLYSKDQTGPIYHDSTSAIPDQISGADDYYNHGIYSGWQHWGMAIGNPLFLSPLYNEDGNLRFRSNRLIARHVGISGNPSQEWKYRLLFSHVRHWGSYLYPLAEVETSIHALGELSYRPAALRHWSFTAALGADKSGLIGNSLGGMLTVCFSR